MILGVEAGGTRTVALLADAEGRQLRRLELGPANLRLLTDAQLGSHFQNLARHFPSLDALGIGMAGAREASDRERIREAAAQAWPGVPAWVGNDLETALAAADSDDSAGWPARVVIISGTGSCCYGRNRAGGTAKVGGWGHLLGDRGSGYDIALRALQATIEAYDVRARWPRLGQRLLRALALNEPNELVTWVHGASKAEVAALAIAVFDAARAHDPLALRTIQGAAADLVVDASSCAAHLVQRATPVEFILSGGTLLKQNRFARLVARGLRKAWPTARTRPLEREGAWGAVHLALSLQARAAVPAAVGGGEPPAECLRSKGWGSLRASSSRDRSDLAPLAAKVTPEIRLPEATAPSPTEARNPRSLALDRLRISDAIRLMLREDNRLPRALSAITAEIERAIRLVVASFRRGGRLFYVGAGTSGRLGVLDASECPPTFSVPAEQVQGVIAGGQRALWSSLEGAEDDSLAGLQAIRCRGVSARDVVVGIAASGRTPFVWGALHGAREAGAKTVLICFNPHLGFARGTRPNVVLAPRIGPEVLTGSTRLKAGTATKMLLNLLSTLAMVRLGKVRENLMVDVRPTNAKLRDRAVRIVQTLCGTNDASARRALEQSGWVVKLALRRLRRRRGGGADPQG